MMKKVGTDLSCILSQITHLTDRQTDRILIARPRLHPMQHSKNVPIIVRLEQRYCVA